MHICSINQSIFDEILNANPDKTKKHINDQVNNGNTASHAACMRGDGFVGPLLQAGADPYVRDENGLNPLDYLPILENGEVRLAEHRRQTVQDCLLSCLP